MQIRVRIYYIHGLLMSKGNRNKIRLYYSSEVYLTALYNVVIQPGTSVILNRSLKQT
jgi:hypothetical protein